MKIIDTGCESAAVNMNIDAALLKDLAKEPEPILRLYDWKNPAATYGYFLDPHVHLRKDANIDLARRPTGGGIIFHLTDFAFSLLIPADHPHFSVNTLDNYRFVHETVIDALKCFDSALSPSLLEKDPVCTGSACNQFCMAKPTQYDVMVQGKKISGGAQRRTRHGFLHQGSICLAVPSRELLEPLFNEGLSLWESINANSFPLLQSNQSLENGKKRLKEALIHSYNEGLHQIG